MRPGSFVLCFLHPSYCDALIYLCLGLKPEVKQPTHGRCYWPSTPLKEQESQSVLCVLVKSQIGVNAVLLHDIAKGVVHDLEPTRRL